MGDFGPEFVRTTSVTDGTVETVPFEASVAVVASTRDHHAVRTFVKGVQVRFAYWGICQLRR